MTHKKRIVIGVLAAVFFVGMGIYWYLSSEAAEEAARWSPRARPRRSLRLRSPIPVASWPPC